MHDRHFHVPEGSGTHPLPEGLMKYASHLSMFLRHTAYVAVEEYVLRNAVQGKLKSVAEKFLPSSVASATAVVISAIAAGALPMLLNKGAHTLESRKLALLTFTETLVAGVIAERGGFNGSVGARVVHGTTANSLE